MKWLLLALICAEGTAVDTPAASIRGHTRTFVMVGARPYYSSSQGRLVERRVAPILQEIFLDASTGVEGVSVALDAWLTVDAGERVLGDRAIADVDQGFVRWRHRELTVTVGRFFNPSITGRGLRVDGGRVVLHPSRAVLGLDLLADVWGGVPVTPSFGQEPLRDAAPVFAQDALDVAPEGADWERPGDWTVGGEIGTSLGRYGAVGLGYARVQDLAEPSRESLSARLEVEPFSWLGARAFGSYSTIYDGLEEAEVSLYAWPIRELRLNLFGRRTDPSLLLPGTSILSVFGGAVHSGLGLEADWFLGGRVRLSGGAELRSTEADVEGDDRALGYRVNAAVRGRVPFITGATGVVAWERLADGWYGGYHQARLGLELPVFAGLGVAVDGGLFIVESETPEAPSPESQIALRGGVAARWTFGAWRAVVALRGTTLERGSDDLAVLGRLEWNGVYSF